MKPLTKEAVGIIRDAYRNGLRVEWIYGEDRLSYSLEPSVFRIYTKDSVHTVSYNVRDVLTHDDTLQILLLNGMRISFQASEGEE